MRSEIFARGPIACGVDSVPILDYTGGVFDDNATSDKIIDHFVSIVGWGDEVQADGTALPYWVL